MPREMTKAQVQALATILAESRPKDMRTKEYRLWADLVLDIRNQFILVHTRWTPEFHEVLPEFETIPVRKRRAA